MAQFSNMDIEEAERRVREMHSRAESYVSNGKNNQNSVKDEKVNIPPPAPSDTPKREDTNQENESEKDSSNFIILVLLILLSGEGADNKLLLALLYLLL